MDLSFLGKGTMADLFTFLLILFCGVFIGFFLAILRTAFVFLNLKRNTKLEDGEVIILKNGKAIETWANARSVLGAFYAIFLALIPFPNSQHILHKKSTMLIFSVVVATLSILVSTTTYATFFHYNIHKHRPNPEEKVENPVRREETKPKKTKTKTHEKHVHKTVGVKHDIDETNVTNLSNQVEKPEHKPANKMVEVRFGIDYERHREKMEDEHRILPERHRDEYWNENERDLNDRDETEKHRYITEKPRQIIQATSEVPEKVQNVTHTVTDTVTHTVTDTVTHTVTNTIKNLFQSLSSNRG